MARLVDIDALRKDFKVAERCEDCQQRHCNADVVFSRRDVCGMLDDAPIIDTQSTMQWVSVKDRLPDDEIECLVVCEDEWVEIGWFYSGKGEWVIDGVVCRDGYVTHWRPLPEPPKEDDI